MSLATLLLLGSAMVSMAAPSSTWTNSTGSISSSSTYLGSGGIVLPHTKTSTTRSSVVSTVSSSFSSTASPSGPRKTTSSVSSTSSDIVTSTLTVPPTGFSTQLATNTQWSSNTWLTTSKDGHSTIVPVIVGCPGCEPIAAGLGIIVWGFPPIPAVLFSFPGFPGLPPFHLPCIKVFGISAGDCPSNPVDAEGTNNDPSNTAKTQSSDKPTSRTSAMSTTSTSSSCSARTVTDCAVACETGITTGSSTQSCSTTCSTTAACSATASTTTSFSGAVCTLDAGGSGNGGVSVWSYDGYVPFTIPNPWIIGGSNITSSSQSRSSSSGSSSSGSSSSRTLSSSPASATLSISTRSVGSPSSTRFSFSGSGSSRTISSGPASTTLSTSTRSGSGSSSSRRISSPGLSSSRSNSARTTSSSTTSRVAAPDITITPTSIPPCVQGYQTYTMPAVMSAPANAPSLKFIIPKADTLDTNWNFTLLKGFTVDPATNVKTWIVGSDTAGKTAPLISSGNGGADMHITWQTPQDSTGVYVELLFNDGLGVQTNGVNIVGNNFACMPDQCSGPPTVTETDTQICTLPPCSTDPSCVLKPLVPHSACDIYTDGLGIIPLWYDVTIYTNNWITDNGDGLKGQEKGCGDLLSWSADTVNQQIDGGAWTAMNAYSFTLPLTIKSGCVERAIKSAGGPDLQCFNYDVTDWGNPFGGIGI